MSTTGPNGKGGSNEGEATGPGASSPQTMIRVLDPSTARFTTAGVPARPTLYLTDRLLVRNYDVGEGRGLVSPELTRALREAGVNYEVHRRGRGNADRGLDAPAAGGPATFTSITLTNAEDPDLPVDAWDVLQRIRESSSDREPIRANVTLEHIIRPAGGFWGGIGGFWGGIGGFWGGIGGFWGGIGGFWGGIGQEGAGLGSASGGVASLNEYGVPGLGGRMPVALTMPDPAQRNVATKKRRPVVAIVDTGIAKHPWFEDPESVERLVLDANGQLVPTEPDDPTGTATKRPIIGAEARSRDTAPSSPASSGRAARRPASCPSPPWTRGGRRGG